jgi:hypothetical protein
MFFSFFLSFFLLFSLSLLMFDIPFLNVEKLVFMAAAAAAARPSFSFFPVPLGQEKMSVGLSLYT